jgi:hypothetical protein
MKNKKRGRPANKFKREKGERYQTLADKIVVLLTNRDDLPRLKLIKLLNTTEGNVDQAIRKNRKSGIKIFPVKGPGTALRIVNSQGDAMKFIAWRRGRCLGTAKDLVFNEHELGQEYRRLSKSSTELLSQINAATNLEE